MNAVSLGPFAFDAERFAAIIGMVAFLAVASVLAYRVDDRLGRWSSWTAGLRRRAWGMFCSMQGVLLQSLGGSFRFGKAASPGAEVQQASP